MSDPYIGEIRIFGGNFAIYNWAYCNGQIMAISQNTALFSILGTYYGGNGISTFGLPNLQGGVAIGAGNGPGLTPRSIGETGGEENVTLTYNEMPMHNHSVFCDTAEGTQSSPVGGIWTAVKKSKVDLNYYAAAPDGTHMNTGAIQATGGQSPHNNIQPYQCLNFIIALYGIYPERS